MLTNLVTIVILIKTTSTQYNANQYYQKMPELYYEQHQPNPQAMNSEEPMEHVYTRRNDRYKYSNSGGNLPLMEYDYNESDECQCFCSQCKDRRPPIPCCKEVCFNCQEMQDQKQGQAGIVFVPYPFPLIVPNLIRNETTSTSTTSTTTTTTTEKPTTTRMFAIRRSMLRHNSYSSRERYDIPRSSQNMNYDSRYMQSSIRKMKPTWEPRYGIIPIPDNLAEKLMSQLRDVKELQARY